MADVVTSQLLENGPRRVVYKFTNFSDGTGESDVVKVNATSTGSLGVVMQGQTFYPGTHMKIVDLIYDVRVMAVRIQWVATANVDAFICSGAGAGPFKMLDERAGFQGIVNNGGTGVTGSLSFTTVDHAAKASYTIVMVLTKGIPQT